MDAIETIIIGGGITGATLLHKLAAAGRDVLLLESSDHLGGVIRSRSVNGAFEELGPNSTVVNDDLAQLIDELGLVDDVVAASPGAKKRFVVRRGKLVAVPTGPREAIASPLFSLAGKL